MSARSCPTGRRCSRSRQTSISSTTRRRGEASGGGARQHSGRAAADAIAICADLDHHVVNTEHTDARVAEALRGDALVRAARVGRAEARGRRSRSAERSPVVASRPGATGGAGSRPRAARGRRRRPRARARRAASRSSSEPMPPAASTGRPEAVAHALEQRRGRARRAFRRARSRCRGVAGRRPRHSARRPRRPRAPRRAPSPTSATMPSRASTRDDEPLAERLGEAARARPARRRPRCRRRRGRRPPRASACCVGERADRRPSLDGHLPAAATSARDERWANPPARGAVEIDDVEARRVCGREAARRAPAGSPARERRPASKSPCSSRTASSPRTSTAGMTRTAGPLPALACTSSLMLAC